MKKSSYLLTTLLIFIILVFFSIPAILPFFHHGFFVTDDAEWMIIRLSAFYAAIRDGQIPVRFVLRLNFEYGYPIGEFLYPAIMYAGTILHALSFGFVNSIKIIMCLSLIGGTVFTYKWLSQLFSRSISIISALVYLYMPYHLYDAFTRGSVGELFALLWIPFILWMIELKNTFFISIGIFFLILSHNTLALLFVPVLFIYSYFKKSIAIRKILITFIIGVLLASFFLIPLFYYLHFTVFSQTKISNTLDYFADYSLVGYITFASLFGAIVLLIRKTHVKNKKIFILLFLLSITSIFFSTNLSTFFWQFLPASFIQFPFRLLSYLIITIPYLNALFISVMHRQGQIIVMCILLTIIAISSFAFISPKSYFDKGEGFYYTNDATTTIHDEYMPLWVKQKPLSRPDKKVEIIKGSGKISNLEFDNKKASFILDLKKNSIVQLNTIYWFGWVAMVDGKVNEINYNNTKGLMNLSIAKGKHFVQFDFTETPIRILGDIVSLMALLLLIILYKKRIL